MNKKFSSIMCIIILVLNFTACSNVQNTSQNTKSETPAQVNDEVKKTSDDNTISFADFSSEISTDRLLERLNILAGHDDARITGTDGEREAGNYIKSEFDAAGMDVYEQEFPFTTVNCEKESFTLLVPENMDITCAAVTKLTPTPAEGVAGEIAVSENKTPKEISGMDLTNKILLTKPGNVNHQWTISRAASKGALGVIFYSDFGEELPMVSLDEKTDISAITIKLKDAKDIIKKLDENQSVAGKIIIQSKEINSTSRNIIGDLKSDKADAKTIIVGAHYDCVDTPGANDNASGVTAIIEAAKILSQKRLQCNIKFIAFGTEEPGLIGSKYYVKTMTPEDKENTIAMINADMVGVGDLLNLYKFSEDDSDTLKLATDCASDLKYTYKTEVNPLSDHSSFAEGGISSVCIIYGPDENYHTDEDSIDKINKETLAKACNIIISMCSGISENQ